FALPRSVLWLPNEVFLPLTGHSRPIAPTPDSRSQISKIAAKTSLPPRYFLAFSFSFLAIGLCGLLRWTFPHSSTRSHTLCGGTASLHCGQIFNAGATRKSWLLRIPCADGDLRRFGTATNDRSESIPVALVLGEKLNYPNPGWHFKSAFS